MPAPLIMLFRKKRILQEDLFPLMKLKREQPLRQPKLSQKDIQVRKIALRKRKAQDVIQNATAEIIAVTAAEKMIRGMIVVRNPLRHL